MFPALGIQNGPPLVSPGVTRAPRRKVVAAARSLPACVPEVKLSDQLITWFGGGGGLEGGSLRLSMTWRVQSPLSWAALRPFRLVSEPKFGGSSLFLKLVAGRKSPTGLLGWPAAMVCSAEMSNVRPMNWPLGVPPRVVPLAPR